MGSKHKPEMISKTTVCLKAVRVAAELTAGSVIFNWEKIAVRLKPDWQADIVKGNHYQNMQCSCDGEKREEHWTFYRSLTHTNIYIHLRLNQAIWSIPSHCYNGDVVKKKLTEWWLSFFFCCITTAERWEKLKYNPLVSLSLSQCWCFGLFSLSVTLYLLSSSLLSPLSLSKSFCFFFFCHYFSFFHRSIAISPSMEWKGHQCITHRDRHS